MIVVDKLESFISEGWQSSSTGTGT